jgi:hypothetical protein
MKSEERHQLLQNDLSVATQRTVTFFERHLGTLIAVVCGALLVGAAVLWWNRSVGSENAEGWADLDAADNLERFGEVVDKFKGKPPAQWAQLHISEKTLESAIPLTFTNREVALTDLKRAREGFEELLKDKSVPSVIRERALWGLALSLETSCDGDTAKPVEAYQKLIDDFPDTIFKVVAVARIESLKKKSAGDFYAWFSKEKPKPPDVRPKDFNINQGHLPPPADKENPDDEPIDFGIPPVEKPKPPAAEKVEAPAPAGDKKESDEKKEGAEKPAEPEAKSKDSEKPSDDKSPKSDDKAPDKN